MPSDCNYQKKKNQLRGPNELINSLLLICTKFIQMCAENGTKYQTFRGFSLFLSGLKQLPHVVHLCLCLVICLRSLWLANSNHFGFVLATVNSDG